MRRIFTFITRLTGLCLRSLHNRFVLWTNPDTSSLLLLTLTDLARSKSELVAENALLRQQVIILRRQMKRPACTRTDRMLLVLLARMVRTWKQALIIVQPETRLARAAPGLQALLEVQVSGSFSLAKNIPADRLLDSGDGKGQSPVGSRTHPGRTPQVRHSRVQAHHSEVYEACSRPKTARTDLGYLPAEPCQRHLGV